MLKYVEGAVENFYKTAIERAKDARPIAIMQLDKQIYYD